MTLISNSLLFLWANGLLFILVSLFFYLLRLCCQLIGT